MHSSVTAGSCRKGCSGVSVSSSAEGSRSARCRLSPATAGSATSLTGLRRTQLVDGAEIHIARHQHLDAIAIALDDGGRNGDGALEHLRHDVLCGAGVVNHRAAVAAAGLHRSLYGAVDSGEQQPRPKALPEVPLHLAGQPRAAELIGAG